MVLNCNIFVFWPSIKRFAQNLPRMEEKKIENWLVNCKMFEVVDYYLLII